MLTYEKQINVEYDKSII